MCLESLAYAFGSLTYIFTSWKMHISEYSCPVSHQRSDFCSAGEYANKTVDIELLVADYYSPVVVLQTV